MSESFAELFEESLKSLDMQPGAIITGIVVDIDGDWVTVHAGLKSEGVIPVEQFYNEQGELTIKVGDEVHVALDAVEDGFGETKLSREKAKRAESWIVLEAAFAADEVVKGVINGKVKGGFTVDVNGIRAFLPGSLVDVRPVRDTTHLEGKELEFKVIKLDQKRNNVVVSRRSVLEAENSAEREALLESLQEGQQVKGIVKNLTDYGCFAELEEGVEGLVHVSEMDWTNKNIHPSKVVQVGDEVEVQVLDIDEERRRISLGIKQCKSNPWEDFSSQFNKGDRISGTIKSITDFGIFIGLDGGIDGLVHLSDISWNEVGEEAVRRFKKGDELETVILSVDPERERISLGIKQLEDDPFSNYASLHEKGSIVRGTVKEVDAKGAVISLGDDIEGILKASEISRDRVEDARNVLKEGEEVEAKIISIDRKSRVISLSVKSKDVDDEKDAMKELRKQEVESAGPTTIGDLIRAQMENQG
ncbi:30S ribosomal protein S1 [Pseudomonas aeruginosa]|uniref:30S ribosomal protein S1 n=1 Tax=Pseudomonas aeruginosa TaxID=287 RepID=UPI000F83A308|nr:30S ribosomal protein S1 [Pseudomonas aeruginosa]RTU18299.1 30S ribosomal protein S1 [Pseudomonas aeruginosa]